MAETDNCTPEITVAVAFCGDLVGTKKLRDFHETVKSSKDIHFWKAIAHRHYLLQTRTRTRDVSVWDLRMFSPEATHYNTMISVVQQRWEVLYISDFWFWSLMCWQTWIQEMQYPCAVCFFICQQKTYEQETYHVDSFNTLLKPCWAVYGQFRTTYSIHRMNLGLDWFVLFQHVRYLEVGQQK